MARYITPSGSAGGRIKKQQVFTTSGTFTPSAELLAAGGSVTVRCVGGGGGGGGTLYGGGSSGMDITRILTVTGPVTVTLGAGGTYTSYAGGSEGGSTSFGGVLSAAGGKIASDVRGARSSGEGSQGGFSPITVNGTQLPGKGGGSGGGMAPAGGYGDALHGLPNTGGGGSGNGSGGSGLCIVTWEE